MKEIKLWKWRQFAASNTLRFLVTIFIHGILITGCHANLPPYFTDDMNNHVIPENTPVGTAVYTLKAVDPEALGLRYGIMGTDKLTVDDRTGIITVAKPIDRETTDRLKVTVTVEDIVGDGKSENNIVTLPVSITISDQNDNAPIWQNQSSFESLEIVEDTRVGNKILSLDVSDPDLTGMALSVNCTASLQSPEACDVFHIDVKEATAGVLRGEMRLAKKLDYNKRSMYQFVLSASDGEHNSKVGVLIRIKDVQNTPPLFTGAMAGRVMEDSPVGTLVMVIQARDGDLGKPREVRLSLLSNPGDAFQLDGKTGHLTTTRPIDREVLGSVLMLQVKAQEIPSADEQSITSQADIDLLQTVANMTVLIDDVNDYAPKFNSKEYTTELSENTPIGTPLPELDMTITDEDTGTFADFTLKIDGPLSELFDIQPKFATGHVRPVIRVKKAFDYENPNERKFLLLIVAQNTDEPELFSTATVIVSTVDENDNKPMFDRDVYSIMVPESAKPGTKIGQITAEDPDSNEFGKEGLVYQVVGTGYKKFRVNNHTGEIFVADCEAFKKGENCLDHETQKSYDLLYMASDMLKAEGYLRSIVPLQVVVGDSNDNAPYFEQEYHRVIPEDTLVFEPRLFIMAKDEDKTAALTYKIINGSSIPNFKIDENTAELLVRSERLPPGNYSFIVEASDGVFETDTKVRITVTDINNHHPAFTEQTLSRRILTVPEDTEVGSVVLQLKAVDHDLNDNGVIRYVIDKGAYGYFEIAEETGELVLAKELDDNVVSHFDLLITAQDLGQPSMRTSTSVQINVGDVYVQLPKIWPVMQRAQVSESAEIGEVATVITTNVDDLNLSVENLDLRFQFVEPVEARNLDNKVIHNFTAMHNWFQIDNEGKVIVGDALMRELVTTINFTVMVTSDKARPGVSHFGTLLLTIFEVNDFPPKVEDLEIETFEELAPGMGILTMEAEDPEGGQISNYFIEHGSEYFSIDNKTGEIKVAGRLDFEDKPIYNFTVVVADSGVPQLSSTATIMVSLLNINDNDPTFNQTEYEASIPENAQEGTYVTTVFATDPDIEDVITYELEPNEYSSAFTINRLGEIKVSKEGVGMLDREGMANPQITLRVKANDTERSGYTTVRITILDVNDNWPRFEQKSYQITVHAPLTAMQDIIKVTANGGDLEETDDMNYKIISGNDEGIFEIDRSSGIVRASQAFEKSGEFRLVIEITDKEEINAVPDHYDQAGVLIQILPGNFRKPEFLFPNKVNSTLVALESDLAEIGKFSNGDYSKVIGQLSAFDPDEGEAGKIQFYIKNGENFVTETDYFRIETDSGTIHQIRPLDREEMNKYDLVVVAKDGGVPVSTQSQHVLTIQIEDIDDHKPVFQKKHYNFSVKENSLENTFIGQVKALDQDEGKNAQIFYFLVSDETNRLLNDDFRVDIKTGMIHTNAVLDRERIEHYLLYVRASPSPIISKSLETMSPGDYKDNPSVATINVTVLDENDNGPRFPEKQYYAAINSDAEPGREILTFDSVDFDSTSPVQYSLLGANLILDDFKSGGSVVPSPFRVDPNSGRLTISATAMRQYAGGNNRFQVKVGVRETIPPYHSDSTLVHVWVVEDTQETVLTLKQPPKEMVTEQLVETLRNITGKMILVTKITPHVTEDSTVNKDWSDVYVTAVDKQSFQTVAVSQFLQALDLGYDRLRGEETQILLHSAVPAVPTAETSGEYYFNGRETFDTAFAGLVALIALLCMGLAAILAVCCCLNKMTADSEKSSNLHGPGMKYPLNPNGSIPGTPLGIRHQQGDMIEDLATDNPLWIDHKMKTYEEQELTMQVASELDNSNGSIEDVDGLEELEDGLLTMSVVEKNMPARQQSPQFSHAYATLHPHPTDSYDNLNILGEDTVAVHL
ncbi:unnamed protein product [Orchesella dallaii]|uniref:Cadherin domain-containing protein n=1 Tax=Orchesella dallaii TaxID=48710 RepID=A0ABP1QX98_9HEXA